MIQAEAPPGSHRGQPRHHGPFSDSVRPATRPSARDHGRNRREAPAGRRHRGNTIRRDHPAPRSRAIGQPAAGIRAGAPHHVEAAQTSGIVATATPVSCSRGQERLGQAKEVSAVSARAAPRTPVLTISEWSRGRGRPGSGMRAPQHDGEHQKATSPGAAPRSPGERQLHESRNTMRRATDHRAQVVARHDEEARPRSSGGVTRR